MLDTVYISAKQTKLIIMIKPKPPFIPIFQVVVSKKDSEIRILNEPLKGSSVFVVETEDRPRLYPTCDFLRSISTRIHTR
jgi:site-specific DNA recombinase